MSDCVFCKIITGEIPGQIIHETNNIIVIKDINPKAPIHDLILPKEHIESLEGLNNFNLASELLLIIKEVAAKEGVAESGYRVILNTGKAGGQLVPHLHFHLLGGKPLGPKIVAE